MRSWLVLALLITVALGIPDPGAAANCWWDTTPNVTRVGEFYVRGSGSELWQESNGVDGLQRGVGACDDGSRVPSDTCYTSIDATLQKHCIDQKLDPFGR